MNRADASSPVFVVGMNGSGTTVLLDCLGRHPGLFAFPRETRLIPYLMAREAGYGDLAADTNFQRLWKDVCSLQVFRELNGNVPVPLPADWAERDRSLAAILDAVFAHFARPHGKTRWCEKTPQHVQHLLALAQRFPRAQFIHMIRDGRDCAASFHRRWRRQPQLTVFRWKKAVTMGRAHGRQLGSARYLEIHYEELTAAPQAVLQRICMFLGVDFDAAMLEASQPYLQPAAGGERRGLRPNSGKWTSYFSPAMQRRLEAIAGRVLAECGYPVSEPFADDDVPGWRRRYWSAIEVLRQYSREVGLKLGGDVKRPWRVILFKPMAAFRQRRHNEY